MINFNTRIFPADMSAEEIEAITLELINAELREFAEENKDE